MSCPGRGQCSQSIFLVLCIVSDCVSSPGLFPLFCKRAAFIFCHLKYVCTYGEWLKENTNPDSLVVSRGAVHSVASSYMQLLYGRWFAPCARHSVRMTYRPSAALRLLGSLGISHNKFLRANK